MSSTGDNREDTTVKGFFNTLCDRFTTHIINNELDSTDAELQRAVRDLIVQFEELWQRLTAVGAFSMNDDLDDYSTTALEMLWTPYLVADLYQRLHVGGGPSASSAAAATAASKSNATATSNAGPSISMRMPGEDGVTTTYSTAPPQNSHLTSLSRQEVLARSNEWFTIFFDWLDNSQIMTESQRREYTDASKTDPRTQRIALARARNEAKKTWSDAETGVQYLQAKRRRMQELMDEDGESMEETGGEEEDTLRRRALARLRWSGLDACHQLHLSTRELDMLRAVQPEQRAGISAQYQRTLEAVRTGGISLGRQTYTILPGGAMVMGTPDRPVAVDQEVLQRSGGLSAQSMSALAGQMMFRQQVKDELMIDRNPTTMTLEAFAQREMADVQRQMMEAAEMEVMRAEENVRLGEEGMEERQRKKDSEWDDWKDNNPAYGPTNKGNYS